MKLYNNIKLFEETIRVSNKTELSALAYSDIPDEKVIAESFNELIKRIHDI